MIMTVAEMNTPTVPEMTSILIVLMMDTHIPNLQNHFDDSSSDDNSSEQFWQHCF